MFEAAVVAQALQKTDQIRQIVFEHVIGGARGGRCLAQLAVVVVGHDDDSWRLDRRSGSAGGCNPVYVEHPDVHEHDIRSLFAVGCNRAGAVFAFHECHWQAA